MKIKVLDHGYVEFVEAWGLGIQPANDDEEIDFERGIIEAARQSTQGSFRGWEEDEKLLKFLFSNQHNTPFEFAGMVLEVQAPIFVFREWHRHRTQSYNEMSARYAPLPALYYLPKMDNLMERGNAASKNRQAQGMTGDLVWQIADGWLKKLNKWYTESEELYQDALKFGIPKELARLSMPVGHYSRMRASASLRNWLAFCTLRCAPNAQWEIRQYADSVANILSQTFPRTFALWAESKFGG